MQIGGLQKCSLIDYPGKVSAVVFATGCNYRCAYCHNPELVYPNLYPKPISEESVFKFLKSRKNQLQAVVISGGEPTVQNDLPAFAAKLKELGYLVKLDTNGSNPAMLKLLLNEGLLNIVAMDIKAPLNEYEQICACKVNIKDIRQSIELIKASGVSHYFRTTVPEGKSGGWKQETALLAKPSPHIFQKEEKTP